GHLPRRVGVDAGDPGVCHGAAQQRHVQHPGQRQVVGPPGPAGDQSRVLLAPAGAPHLRFGNSGHDCDTSEGMLAVTGSCGTSACRAADGICSAAARTALTMFWYPVHRHRLPSRPERTSSSSGSGFSFSRSSACMSIPGVQKPHCSAWLSWNACCSGCSSPSSAKPSMVVLSRPSACTANTEQDFTRCPSRWTVQAPQLLVSQPTTVPTLPSRSRRYCTSSMRGSTSSV